MPRNNGIYSPPPSNWWPAVDGQPADPEAFNELLSDIAAALTQSASRDGQSQITGDFHFGGNRITNLGAASTNNDALRRAAIAKGIVIESAPSITIPSEGMLFDVTGDTTISAINGSFPGKIALLRFESDVVFKHSLTLICPGSRDYYGRAGQISIIAKVDGTAWQILSGSGGSDGFQVGDFVDTVRDMDSSWLRRDGRAYFKEDYPELSEIMPPVPPGLSWMARPSGANSPISGMCEGPDGLYAVHFSSENFTVVTKSVNGGQTWNVIATVTGFTGTSIAFGNGVFVMVGRDHASTRGASIVSLDGVSWSPPELVTGTNDFLRGISFGNGKFVAVNFPGTFPGVIVTTENGTSWTQRRSTSGVTYLSTHFVNDKFVVVGNNSEKLLSSDDALSWSVRYSSGSSGLSGVDYFEGLYVAVGGSGTIITSPDLVVWTPRLSPVSSALVGVKAYSDGVLATGTNGAAIFSIDGIFWSVTPTGASGELRALLTNPDNDSQVLVTGPATEILISQAVLPTQFVVPDDNPKYGWIKAL